MVNHLKKIIKIHLLATINPAVIVVLTLFVFSCGKKNNEAVEIPPGIIGRDTFARILVDFALAESAANMNIKNTLLLKLDSVYAFDPLEDNGVTLARYDSSIAFYVRNPEVYKKIYEQVLASMSEIQTKRNPVKKDTNSK